MERDWSSKNSLAGQKSTFAIFEMQNEKLKFVMTIDLIKLDLWC